MTITNPVLFCAYVFCIFLIAQKHCIYPMCVYYLHCELLPGTCTQEGQRGRGEESQASGKEEEI